MRTYCEYITALPSSINEMLIRATENCDFSSELEQSLTRLLYTPHKKSVNGSAYTQEEVDVWSEVVKEGNVDILRGLENAFVRDGETCRKLNI